MRNKNLNSTRLVLMWCHDLPTSCLTETALHPCTICLRCSLRNCLHFPAFWNCTYAGVHFWLITLGNFSWGSNCVTLAGIHATVVLLCWRALQRDWWEVTFIHSLRAHIYSNDIFSMGKRKFVLSIFKKARVGNSAKSCTLLWIFWSGHCCNCCLFHGN